MRVPIGSTVWRHGETGPDDLAEKRAFPLEIFDGRRGIHFGKFIPGGRLGKGIGHKLSFF